MNDNKLLNYLRPTRVHVESPRVLMCSKNIHIWWVCCSFPFRHIRSCKSPTNNEYECRRKAALSTVLPPVVSAKLNTKNSFNFRYGRVEIRAKLPKGDWIFPRNLCFCYYLVHGDGCENSHPPRRRRWGLEIPRSSLWWHQTTLILTNRLFSVHRVASAAGRKLLWLRRFGLWHAARRSHPFQRGTDNAGRYQDRWPSAAGRRYHNNPGTASFCVSPGERFGRAFQR